MKFKEIRDKIYSSCKVIIGNSIYDVSTHFDTQFDDREVEGIRSREKIINGCYSDSYIEVLLK